MGMGNLETLSLRRNWIKSLDEALFDETNKLIKLHLDENDLTVLPNGLFIGLQNLEILYLSKNQINSLDETLFAETNNLTKLHLDDNNLAVLPKGLFMGLSKLETLSLRRNRIHSLDEELFDEAKKLTELYLDENDLTVIPKGLFFGLTNLETLYLSKNQINSLDGEMFAETNKLIELYLNENNLTVLTKGLFMGMRNLETLSLRRNRIKSLDEALFKETNKLIKLHLDENDLTVLPNGLFIGLQNLEILYLSNSQIKSLDETLFAETNNLTKLYLDDNNLAVLLKGLFMGCSKLENLSLRRNRIHSLDEELFNEAKNLRQLYLAENDLTVLPTRLFTGMRNIHFLSLWKNQINSLDGKLFEDTNKLAYLLLDFNNLTFLPKGLFMGLGNLIFLTLWNNQVNSVDAELFNETSKLLALGLGTNNLTVLPDGLFKGLTDLSILEVQENQISSLQNNVFKGLSNLRSLYLGHNKIVDVHANAFHDLINLKQLYLHDNELIDVNKKILRNLFSLQYLYLQNNGFKALEVDLFQYSRKISLLDLSGNKLQNIPDISYLGQLFYLNVKNNIMTSITYETFSNLPKETDLIVSQHEICECYVSDNVSCTTLDNRSPFLTCERLLSYRVLMVVIWLIGLNAIWGNVFVLWQRKSIMNKSNVQNFLLGNLAVSDLLMGIYMLLIASADIYFREYFPMHAETWRSGITCRIAGPLSIVSSEASLFFVTFISINRFINIRYPLSRRILTMKASTVATVFLWITSLALGLVPSSLAGQNNRFYANSHVCIGLPLSSLPEYETINLGRVSICPPDVDLCYYKESVTSEYQGEVNGMIFASVMFLGLNLIYSLVILTCYVEIVKAYCQAFKRVGLNPEMKENIQLSREVAAIVLTDFACWFPIIIIGILVQAGVLTLPADVFAWCVTFVLPINAAVNPYLYTIASVISKRRKQTPTSLQGSTHVSEQSAEAPGVSNSQDIELKVLTT